MWMKLLQSRITAQGQISVPAEVRKRLGVGPGAVLEWELRDDSFIVRRAGTTTTLDAHHALFGDVAGPQRRPAETKEAIAAYIRKRHARR
jgi:AbrB family looped-hinge helix DNA binding protein